MQAIVLANQTPDRAPGAGPVSSWQLCGPSILERQRRTLELVGVTDIAVIVSAEMRQAVEASVAGAGRASVRIVTADQSDGDSALSKAAEIITGSALLQSGDLVLDERVLVEMVKQKAGTILVDDRDPVTGNSGPRVPCGAAVVNRAMLERWAERFRKEKSIWENALDDPDVTYFGVDRVDAHVAKMKRTFRPYWFRLGSKNDLEAGRRILFDSIGKANQDFLADYVHPPIENAFVALFARLGITPTAVTLMDYAAAALGLFFFARGDFWSGVFCAFAVGILDGVDGKLARITLRFSKAGGWLCDFDWVWEIGWFLAIGWALYQRTGEPVHLLLAAVIVICTYVLQGLTRVHFWLRMRRSPYDYEPFDAKFMLVGGRRNIFVPLFFIGLVVGEVAIAWWCIAVWAAVSTFITTWRIYYLMWRDRAKATLGAGTSGQAAITALARLLRRD